MSATDEQETPDCVAVYQDSEPGTIVGWEGFGALLRVTVLGP